jgi:hypothetical protein
MLLQRALVAASSPLADIHLCQMRQSRPKAPVSLYCSQPTQGQLRALLATAFVDVEAAANTVAAFNLLKAIIARRFMLEEVYDLIKRVQELMISSHVRH